MSPYNTIAIVGASGNVGRIILDGLIASSKFEITAISRQESNATFPTGVTVRKTDFTDADLQAAFKGHDVVISALGAGGFDEQKKLVDAALSAGVKHFLPSEFSASVEDEAVLQLLPLFGQKKELIKYLQSKESTGLSWTGIAISGLFDWGLETGFLGFDLAKHTATIWDDGSKVFTLTNKQQLVDAVVSVLEHHRETRNRYIYVYSVETSQNEILASLEKATGAKWDVTTTTTDEQIEAAGKLLSVGDFTGAFILVRATLFGSTAGLRSNYAKEENLANGILGLETETVQETVDRVLRK
ncbi:NmrA-like family protein [Dactylonectria estremocensis]|uniref:NmrA-like family protein n=1 Tax=Dactylonectria estremocensis TaxID=1079267 RepID=A0A9P9DQ68_9HYPO|nr:NmrA-like family protein [Dactylonectria estremocensis]